MTDETVDGARGRYQRSFPGAGEGLGAETESHFADHLIDNEQFRLLAENIPTLCWMANADGYIFWYNRRWHDYCGTTPEAMEGWGWQSVNDPEILPAVLERWTASIKSGDAFEMTFPLRGSDGVFRPFLTRVEPVRDDHGTVTRWFGVNTDMSTQYKAEADLRAANETLQAGAAERVALLSQLCEGVIVTDPDGRITFVNEAAERLHGGVHLDVAPEDYSRAYSLFTEAGEPFPIESLPLTRAVRDGETVIDAHWKIRHANGREVLAIGNAKTFHAEDGIMLGAVLTIRDDTRRRAAEDALREALQAKEILLHEVNHRVKNSLQLVTSLLSLQASKAVSDELKQSLLEARARIGVIASVHQRLYTTSEHDRVDLSTYLGELAKETLGAFNTGSRITLDFDCPAPVVIPLDQAVPVALVISELLTNAVKYAFADRPAGTIGVSIGLNGHEIAIKLTDDGCGLPDGFDPQASTGLGMRIVMALVGQLRGTLKLLNLKAGAGFQIVFLRAADAASLAERV